MVKKTNESFSTGLSDIIIQGIQEKKGNEIVRLNLREVKGSVTDYFVICHADSAAQISAITKGIEDEVYKTLKQNPWHKEGVEQGEWVVLDFVDVVVHIFRTDKRSHYGIEDLWGDAEAQYFQSA